MTETTYKLLVMDDDESVCALLGKAARRMGFETECVTDPLTFHDAVERLQPSAVITDLQMPGLDGIELLRDLGSTGYEGAVLITSGMDTRTLHSSETVGKSYGLNVLGSLRKPIRLPDLDEYLQQVIDSTRVFSPDALQAAINDGQMIVHYQPKVTRESGRWLVRDAEALVRWNHPTYGLVMPLDFIPLAEETGAIAALTDSVLQQSVQQLRAWTELGLDINVAVNLSGHLVEDLEFPDRLCLLLKEHSVDGSRLSLELTETAAMKDPHAAMDILVRLRVKGIHLAIDDFGTGYSSLQQLYKLPFAELKIDRSFVVGLPGDCEARSIVQGTVDLAHALGMTACAEGVETQAALDYLETIGCDKAQGYLISRPVPASEIAAFVSRWNGLQVARRSA